MRSEGEHLPGNRWLRRYNSDDLSIAERHAILCGNLAKVGEDAEIRPPFQCDFGRNIAIGDRGFPNVNCVILDLASVTIGARTAIGPGVQLLTSEHPRDVSRRREGLRWVVPVEIGVDMWIGAGAIVLPGVSIGDGAIIGAGSVVTRSFSPGVTVAGVPARPLGRRTSRSGALSE